MFHTHFPARGRKHRCNFRRDFQSTEVSYPFPRKGTETLHGQMWQRRCLQSAGFKPNTPQGDVNPILDDEN